VGEATRGIAFPKSVGCGEQEGPAGSFIRIAWEIEEGIEKKKAERYGTTRKTRAVWGKGGV